MAEGNVEVGGTLYADRLNTTSIVSDEDTLYLTKDTIVRGGLDVSGPLSTADESLFMGPAVFGDIAQVAGDLDVGGSANISGAVRVARRAVVEGDTIVGGNLQAGGDADIFGNATLQGALFVAGASVMQSVIALGNTLIDQDLDVVGNAGLAGKLEVAGDSRFNADVEMLKKLVVGDDVSAGSLTAMCGLDAGCNSTLQDATVLGELQVGGPANFAGEITIADALLVEKSATFLDSLRVGTGFSVGGDAELAGAVRVFGTLTADGDVRVKGNLIVDGCIEATACPTSSAGEARRTLMDGDGVSSFLERHALPTVLTLESLTARMAVIESELRVDGNAVLGADLRVGGDVLLDKGFAVRGPSIHVADSNFERNVAVGETLSATNLAASGSLSIGGPATVGGGLSLGGSISVPHAIYANDAEIPADISLVACSAPGTTLILPSDARPGHAVTIKDVSGAVSAERPLTIVSPSAPIEGNAAGLRITSPSGAVNVFLTERLGWVVASAAGPHEVTQIHEVVTTDELVAIFQDAGAGDLVLLTGSEDYILSNDLSLTRPVVVRRPAGAEAVAIRLPHAISAASSAIFFDGVLIEAQSHDNDSQSAPCALECEKPELIAVRHSGGPCCLTEGYVA